MVLLVLLVFSGGIKDKGEISERRGLARGGGGATALDFALRAVPGAGPATMQ